MRLRIVKTPQQLRLSARRLYLFCILTGVLSAGVFLTGFTWLGENYQNENERLYTNSTSDFKSSETADQMKPHSTSSTQTSTTQTSSTQTSSTQTSSTKPTATSTVFETTNESYQRESSSTTYETTESQYEMLESEVQETDLTEKQETKNSEDNYWLILIAILICAIVTTVVTVLNYLIMNKQNRHLDKNLKRTTEEVKVCQEKVNKLNYDSQGQYNQIIGILNQSTMRPSTQSAAQNVVPIPSKPIWDRTPQDRGPNQSNLRPLVIPGNSANIPQIQQIDEEALIKYCKDLFTNPNALSNVFRYQHAGVTAHSENPLRQETQFGILSSGDVAARFMLINPPVNNQYAIIPKSQNGYSGQDLIWFKNAFDFSGQPIANATDIYTITLIRVAFLARTEVGFVLETKGELEVRNLQQG